MGELGGIHHVTAVTGRARQNLDFYTSILGLRLVKKTVNQDVTSSYHLFYGDKLGSPGTDMTFFDWPNVPPHQSGRGDVAATAFIAPLDSLDWWQDRLAEAGVAESQIVERAGKRVLPLTDPEGQRLELVEGGDIGAVPWTDGVPEAKALRGLSSVTMATASLEPTATMLEQVLGFRRMVTTRSIPSTDENRLMFEMGPGGPGAQVFLCVTPDLPRAVVGIGGVHHVAFRTPNEEEHRDWRNRVAQAGLPVTEVIDRFYFKSIYFREPGGVLFEIATDGPGFAQDEDTAHLGETLSLPPFLESQRSEIEAQLQPI